MKIIESKTFNVSFVIGRNIGYSNNLLSIEEIEQSILKAQKIINDKYKVPLSAKLKECKIIFLGQNEPSVEVSFIQYPKFPIDELDYKTAIIEFVKLLMDLLQQNRIVIVFPDNTMSLEKSEDIDSSININQD